MDGSLRDYHLRPPSRGRTPIKYDSYLDTSEYNDTRESLAPSRSRASTPSAAVRRAMQVLDETYRQQSFLKGDRWSRSADQGSVYSGPIRARRRSPSPIRSRSPSPIRRINSPPLWAPSRLVEIERDNFHEALDDSESRREILLKKLSDAQKTMEIQNERMRDGEMDINECRATIRLLQQVQQELETKTQFLQKERDNFAAKSRQDAEDREVQRRKIDDVTRESNRHRCQLDLMLADKEQHHVTLESLHKTIKDLKDEVKSTNELQTKTNSDLQTSQERMNVARQRCELLEKEKNHAFSELEKSQKTQQALINRNTDLGQRLSRGEGDLQELSARFDKTNHEFGHAREELGICRDKLKKQNKDLSELRKSHSEMQSDRERALKYNQELEKTVHSIKEINLQLKEAKVAREDDLTDLHADLAKTRLELSKVSEENASNQGYLKESRRNCKQLTTELIELRPRVEDLTAKVKELEGTHNVDVQQMSLLDAQKSQLNREKDDVTTKLSTLQESYEQLEVHHNDEMKKLNKELNQVRHEKDKANSQCRDAQVQFARIKEELESNTEHTQTQLDHWRKACSKLTSLVEEKDDDLRESATQRREAEENYALAEAQRRTFEIQLDEAQISQEELTKLRSENKKLSQECAENQQMIAVVEMQRDILAKSPSKANAQESVSKAQIEKLQAELSLTNSQLKKVESERDELQHNKTNSSFIEQSNDADVARLKGMNRILVEQLAKVRQEAETLQTLLDEKSRIHDRDVRSLERGKQQLDLRMASMADELNALKITKSRRASEGNAELKSLRAEALWMKQDLEEKNQQVMVMKGESVILENGKKRAEDRVAVLEASLEELRELRDRSRFSPIKTPDERTASDLRIKTAKLEAAEAENATLRMQTGELESVRSSQQGLIDALKMKIEKGGTISCDSDGSASVSDVSAAREVKSLKRDLQRAVEDIGGRDKQISELKKKFLESQKLEQRVRQERDELQGKTIIMESLNDSSQDLLNELEEVRKDKSNLEKQLSTFLSSKTSQTPPPSLSLAEDLDKELEKQYNTVCERNNWLETRIVSLQREIELVRDQNSLLQEQRNTAERDAAKLREDWKELQMTSKGSRRQSEVEQIHLQHSNAEKMQKILDLERELTEKRQLIQAMAKEMESLQKKSDKGKISSFMKKLRRSSDTSSRSQERLSNLYATSTEGQGSPISTLDTGYSTLSLPQVKSKKSSSLSPKSRSSSFGGISKSSRNSPKSPKSQKSPHASLTPASPTLTYVTAMDDVTEGYSPSTGNRSRRKSSERHVSPTRVSFDESSDQDADVIPPPAEFGGRSRSRDSSPKRDSSTAGEEEEGVFFAEDYIQEDDRLPKILSLKGRSSGIPSPDGSEPHPEQPVGLPSPTSSPSLPSPSSAGKRSLPVYVVAASDDSEDDSVSFETEETESNGGDASHYSRPVETKPRGSALSVPRSNKVSREQEYSPPPRPQSQPTFKELTLSPASTSTRKKHSSLV